MSEHDDLNRLLENTTPRRRKSRLDTCEDYSIRSENDSISLSVVQWTTNDNKIFVPAGRTCSELVPGVYDIKTAANFGTYFERIPVKTEGLIRFPDSNSERVVAEIQKFWERENFFEEFNLLHKRGIILYGPPGGGKSCTLQLVMSDVVNRGGVVVQFGHPEVFVDGMRKFREVQPDTPVVIIMEDIDSTLEVYNESEVLNILDGVNRINKVVFLATTNYPELLGARVVNRPSRFDKRFRIGHPSAEARRIYFDHLCDGRDFKELGIDLDRWVEDTDKMSIAHLRELFIAVVVLGDSYEEAIETLRTMKESIDDREYDQVGFHARS